MASTVASKADGNTHLANWFWDWYLWKTCYWRLLGWHTTMGACCAEVVSAGSTGDQLDYHSQYHGHEGGLWWVSRVCALWSQVCLLNVLISMTSVENVSFKQDSELIGFKQVCCSTHQATRVGDEYHTHKWAGHTAHYLWPRFDRNVSWLVWASQHIPTYLWSTACQSHHQLHHKQVFYFTLFFFQFPNFLFSAFLCCHLLFLVLILIHIYFFCATHH